MFGEWLHVFQQMNGFIKVFLVLELSLVGLVQSESKYILMFEIYGWMMIHVMLHLRCMRI